jgi:hypothetical protein
VNLFVYLVVAWWIFYRWRNQQEWTFSLFVFVLVSPTILYLASMLLFPPEGSSGEPIDYKTHYYANHRAFFTIFSMFTVVDVVDTLLKGIPHFLALGKAYITSNALYFVGMVTAANAKRTLSAVLCDFLSGPNHRDQLSAFPDSCLNSIRVAKLVFCFSALRGACDRSLPEAG